MGRLLVLRPEPGASATVERARHYGLHAVAVSLFRLGPIAWTAPEPQHYDGLLLTSANAVRFGGEQLACLRSLKVFAVGDATATAAIKAGFEVAMTGAFGVDHLLKSVDPDLRLLHLCGFDRREPDMPRQAITPVIAYRSTPIERPALAVLPTDVALVHSPEAGRRFAELVSTRHEISIVAISMAAARASGGGWATVQVASEPSDDALLALASSLCNKPAP